MMEGSVSGEKKKNNRRRRRRCENEEKKGEMEVNGRMKGERKKQRVKEMTMNPKKNKGSSSSGSGSGGFHGCYLLTSLSPRYKGHTYIGYTVNPKRRIRQHNGEICSGASTTKKKRPWELLLCIHGFPSSTCALQFEWAWQHPKESIAVREAAASFKTVGGVANKIKLALTMLTLPPWLPLDLRVSFFSTKYMNHTAGASPLLNLHFCSIDDLPCYSLSPLLPNINDDPNVLIPPQPQPHYYHLDIDDDDSVEIHPHSPPIATQPFTQSHQTTTLSHHSQLTLQGQGHYTQLSTLSMDQQLPQDDDMICVMMDDNITGNTQLTHHHSPSTLSHTSPIPPPKHKTPLIDLLTPSPDTRIIRATRKQRPPSTSPDIIDLTSGCERVVKDAILKLRGVDSVEVDLKMEKVTVAGYVDRKRILKAVRRAGKRAEYWPNPCPPLYFTSSANYFKDLSNDYKESYNYYYHGYNVGDRHGTIPISSRGDDKVSNMFNDDNVNACTLM